MDDSLTSERARQQRSPESAAHLAPDESGHLPGVLVRRGHDRTEEPCHFSPLDHIEFKVSTHDTAGALCVFETVTSASIGPPAHPNAIRR
jgi:hypothetical protein